MADEERLLTPMQMRFVTEYVADSSSIKAAVIRAGYSPNNASEKGCALLRDPRIKKLLEEARQQAVKSLGITTERVLQELWKVAGANPGDVVQVNEDGETQVNPRGAGEVAVTTIDGNGKKVKSVTTKTVKPADKVAALDKVAKILNLFPKEEKVEVELSFADLVQKAIKDSEPKVIESDEDLIGQ